MRLIKSPRRLVNLLAAALYSSAPGQGADLVPTAVRRFENAAELATASGVSDGQRVDLIGRNSVAADIVPDGGGGALVYRKTSTATVDGGTVYNGPGGVGRFHRVIDGPVNVRWFGAVGNGLTDDTAAIQAALDYIATASGGTSYQDSAGKLIFPKSKYLVKRPLMIGGDCLVIDGMGSTIIKDTDDIPVATWPNLSADIPGGAVNPNVNAIFVTAARKLRFSKLIDFNLSGGGSATPIGIWGVGNENTFADIYMRGVSVGMHIPSMWMSTLSHVIVRMPTSHGFFWDRARVSGTGQSGTSVTFTNCYAISPGGKGFYLQDLDYPSLLSCAVDGGMEECYFFQGCNGIAGNIAFERMNPASTLPAIRCSGGAQGLLTIDSYDNVALDKPAVRLTDSKLVLQGRLRVGYTKFFDVTLGAVLDATGLSIEPTAGTELDWTKYVASNGVSGQGGQILYSPRLSPGRNYPTYIVNEDGVRITRQQAGVSPDRGNADVPLTHANSARTQRFATPLSAPRVVTLPTDNIAAGLSYRILREATATGASALTVGGVLVLAAGQWGEVEYDGASWVVTAKGTL